MYADDDDDLDTLATDSIPRDELGRFTSPTEGDDVPTDPSAEPDAGDGVGDPADPSAAPAEPPAPAADEGQPDPVPEPGPDALAEPPVDDKLKDQKVPYKRFKEAVTKEREARAAAEKELAELRARLGETPDVDVSEAELDELGNLLIEGKTAEYGKGMKNILTKVFQAGLQAATERARDVTRIETAAEREAREMQEAAQRWAREYPTFDPASPSFDADMLEEALALRDAYMDRGMSPSAAIERAVKRIAGDLTPAAPAPAPAPASARPNTVPQKIAAAAQQPPVPAGTGEYDQPRSLLSKIAEMSDEDFDKLSEADLEMLRRGINL